MRHTRGVKKKEKKEEEKKKKKKKEEENEMGGSRGGKLRTTTNQNQQQQKQKQTKKTKKNWRQEEGMKRGKNRGGETKQERKTKTTINKNHNKTTGAGIVRWNTRCRPANCLFVRVTPLRTTPPGSPYCQQGDTTWEPCSPIARKPDFPGLTTP